MKSRHELLQRITIDPQVMLGKPLVKGTRLTVQYILGLLAQGIETKEILQEYDRLAEKDILACLLFAKETLEDIKFTPCSARNEQRNEIVLPYAIKSL